jgi:disulfide bond formation protein DsbB
MSNRTSESQMPAFVPALVLLGFFVLILVLLLPHPVVRPASPSALTTLPPTAIAVVPTNLPATTVAVYNPAAVTEGQGVYQSICSACHGLDAHGIPGLGKNLIESQFVHELTDDELLDFIIMGRDTSDILSTTGIAMPPRGGNPSLTDEQLRAVITYLRSQADTLAMARSAPTATPASVVQAVPTAIPTTLQTTTAIATRIPITPQPFSVSSAYAWSCAGCHGSDGMGNAHFGPEFHSSALLGDRAALLNFLIDERPLIDPRVEFPHPARGGYPPLTDEQLTELADYVSSMVGGDSQP